jgi:hypothetical protein
MGYKITITILDTSLLHDVSIGNSTLFYYETRFEQMRLGYGQTTLEQDIYEQVTRLTESFNLDYNSTNDFIVERGSNWMSFKSFTYFNNGEIDNIVINAAGSLSVTVEDYNQGLTLYPYIGSSNCNAVIPAVNSNIIMTELTYQGINEIYYPNSTSHNTTQGTQRRELQRLLNSYTCLLTATDQNNNIATAFLTIPPLLQQNLFTINQVSTAGGVNVTITIANVGLTISYSIDGIIWAELNQYILTNLQNGDIIVYVRDEFGCTIELPIHISFSYVNQPFASISKSNSIRYKNNVVFGTCNNYKNDENTLSCETLNVLNYREMQLFQTCDIVRTQFKSNYRNITVTIGDSQIQLIQTTNNIGLKQKLDAEASNDGFNTYVYFMSGNIYDWTSGLPIEQHQLLGTLPEWAEIGNSIWVNNVFYIIENIIYSEASNLWTIEIPILLSGDIIVGSIYNKENYDVYEFDVDFLNYQDQNVQVKIVNEDDNFETVTFLSELINVKTEHKNTLYIEYWNEYNTDIIYNGWKHKLRLLYQEISMDFSESFDFYKGDTHAVLYNSQNYDINKFKFEPVTRELAYKINLALSHKFVIINSVRYIKSSNIEQEKIGKDANLYEIIAKMLKATDGVTVGNSNISSVFISNFGLLEDELNGIIITN